jgi:hypothetical protein
MRQHTIQLRQSPKNKQFYVRIVAPNGKVIFEGGEGHLKKKQHLDMIAKLTSAITDGKYKIVDETEAKAPAKKAVAKKVKVMPKVTTTASSSMLQ